MKSIGIFGGCFKGWAVGRAVGWFSMEYLRPDGTWERKPYYFQDQDEMLILVKRLLA